MSIVNNSDFNGAVIKEIVLRTGDDATVYKNEYGQYELMVMTDKGVLVFAGCHDVGGEIEKISIHDVIARLKL